MSVRIRDIRFLIHWGDHGSQRGLSLFRRALFLCESDRVKGNR
jgi:hypothetical protein